MTDGRMVLQMDENEKIDEIKEKILNNIDATLDHMSINLNTDVRCSMVIKNLVESYDILNNIREEF